MKLLLDTCTFLWLISGSDRLSAHAHRLFAAADNEVFLSAASAWEIAVKHALGRLPLPEAPERFVPAQREAHGITSLDLDEQAALQVSKLPSLHRDPFDRMLVSQAVGDGLVILTPDEDIRRYPVRTEW